MIESTIIQDVEYYTGKEKEQKIYEYFDKVIRITPDIDGFLFSVIIQDVEPDLKERAKFFNLAH
ncbi:hypothetical protein [Elizabethkingia bruuniana]|uniref:Uncharacterized protein n=1 Tax=Elizabethkingia bruuniana TaxID=1756149 RepID=A0A7T7UXZ9_9FLAO|nr:hypothetical protein [Elizabethkingia bruuniana]AQX84818.1 hypothetical protein AYC65_07265 [Elizabethkingia bruuniana]KUY28999.1 hypothetical protein ATB97_02405 [Elizabethkingia bruuniana]OPB70626.1 hypothetical protein BAY12_18515 [Elizabethkingia bruuniana]QDZ62683.1 hypothetical protein EVD20_07945 [Elizabethkingia bruuniana]QQN58294.1 hypothetical protein I6H88_17965 [Elizabethkingia bruuniana]